MDINHLIMWGGTALNAVAMGFNIFSIRTARKGVDFNERLSLAYTDALDTIYDRIDQLTKLGVATLDTSRPLAFEDAFRSDHEMIARLQWLKDQHIGADGELIDKTDEILFRVTRPPLPEMMA